MDLVAPSGNIGSGDIRTTDRMGNLGYNNTNYMANFGGTSAACPQVAGVAALMLSVRPDLTEAQVRTILQNTARDLGSAGFDNTYGYGLVDAYAAVYAVAPRISGPTLVCNQATYTIENLPAGATVQWSYSLNLLPLESNNHTLRVERAIPPAGPSSGCVSATVSFNGTEICTLREEVWVGPPQQAPLFINVIPRNPYTRQQVILQAEADNSSLFNYHFKWDVGSHTILSGSLNDSEILVETLDGLSYWAIFRVSTENACGCSPAIEKRVYVTQWGGGDVNPQPANSSSFSLTPNPATDVVTVRLNETETPQTTRATQSLSKTAASPGVYEIQLWSAGAMIRSYKTDRSAFEMPVSELLPGIYFVRILKDGKTYTEKLIKKSEK